MQNGGKQQAVDFKPWELYPHIWRTESAWLSFIRGGIRRYLWSKNPVKLEFMKEKRVMIPNPSKRKGAKAQVWGAQCEMCHKLAPQKDIEVDHKVGERGNLRSAKDIQSYVENIVFVRKEDLAILCKPCHKTKTYSERSGMSLEDAAIEKEAISICKQSAAVVKSWLTERGVTPGKTVGDRRVQVVQALKQSLL